MTDDQLLLLLCSAFEVNYSSNLNWEKPLPLLVVGRDGTLIHMLYIKDIRRRAKEHYDCGNTYAHVRAPDFLPYVQHGKSFQEQLDTLPVIDSSNSDSPTRDVNRLGQLIYDTAQGDWESMIKPKMAADADNHPLNTFLS